MSTNVIPFEKPETPKPSPGEPIWPERFVTTEQLAAKFGFSCHWIYKLNKRGKGPPRLKDVHPHRYDTKSRAFAEWLRSMGVDTGENGDV